MLIRIRRHDKISQETQVPDWYRYIILAIGATKAFIRTEYGDSASNADQSNNC